MGYAAQQGSPLNKKKIIRDLGVVMSNAHYQGLQYGADFDNLNNLPLVENGIITTDDTIWANYDKDTFPFAGVWDTDSRLCLKAVAPKPCTLLAVSFGVQTNES